MKKVLITLISTILIISCDSNQSNIKQSKVSYDTAHYVLNVVDLTKYITVRYDSALCNGKYIKFKCYDTAYIDWDTTTIKERKPYNLIVYLIIKYTTNYYGFYKIQNGEASYFEKLHKEIIAYQDCNHQQDIKIYQVLHCKYRDFLKKGKWDVNDIISHMDATLGPNIVDNVNPKNYDSLSPVYQ